jgi:hypothetical protein
MIIPGMGLVARVCLPVMGRVRGRIPPTRGERRFFMKGSLRGLSLVALLILILATIVVADEYVMPVTKTVRTGSLTIRFDGINYQFNTDRIVTITLSKLDDRWVRCHIKPIGGGVLPFCEVSAQWNAFPPVSLPLGSGDGNDYSLDTETGYAEK